MEMMAREVAQAHLGAPVHQHDDNSRDAMPDARICYPDGRRGWLEVVTDTDGSYDAQQKALEGHDVIRVEGLRWAWLIHVSHQTRIATLPRWLAPLLKSAEERSGGDAQRARHLVKTAGHGVTHATPLRGRSPGDVVVRPSASSHAHHVDEMSAWVSAFFARHRDVADKMSADGREEQHAFVWTTSDSGPEQAFVLAQRGLPFRPPAEDPPLPAGVTHLWIAGAGTADRAIAWFPHRGWHEVTGHWTRTPAGRAMLDSAGRGHLSG